jgi:hypothetical protein
LLGSGKAPGWRKLMMRPDYEQAKALLAQAFD